MKRSLFSLSLLSLGGSLWRKVRFGLTRTCAKTERMSVGTIGAILLRPPRIIASIREA